MDALRIFVGFDPREAVAYHVCCHSLIRHSSRPLLITPLALNHFTSVYEEFHTDGSNAFIYSRFLVPYLCGFKGHALYLDGDMVVKDDVAKLFEFARLDREIMVVKHDYQTKAKTKYLGNKNEDYPRKNWSSVILWNCGNYPNRVLLPGFVEGQKGEYLHRFSWIEDHRIGELPIEWNWLVGEYETNHDAKLLHYTLGVPAFGFDVPIDHRVDWWDEFNQMIHVQK